jgi:hypothetical protein
VVDSDVVDCGHAQEGNCAHVPGGDWMVLFVEANLVGRPPKLVAIYAWLCCHDLSR